MNNTENADEKSFDEGNKQVVPPSHVSRGENTVTTPNTGAINFAPKESFDSINQDNKCASERQVILSYSIAIILILGGIVCFFYGHSIFGSILTVFGILWIVSDINAGKARKKRQSEEMFMQQCIDSVFCSNVIKAVKYNLPLDEMVSVFKSKNPDEQKYNLEKVFTEIMNASMEDGIITDAEEDGIRKLIEQFNINVTTDLTYSKLYDKYVKMLTIKDMLNGVFPMRKEFQISDYYLNLEKGEQIIWKFDLCEYYQEVTTTTYVSKHSGGSIRIAKGFYMRSGTTTTTPIKETEMKAKANGTLFIGTKNLYFYSTTKTVKIPYKKVVSFTPYSDGLGLQKDGENSKPQAFKGIDGWFVYNIVINIQNLDA
ncbi:MAG: hypothetical protein IKP73_22025 [Bacteroidales bacterium]|nr:hypothetical protein [Bacteroidales bacterium]MBR6178803.1 hypothetical protein [Bacteroidales bacterium]